MGFRENLKSELTFIGMPVKELAAKSGVNRHSIDHYLSSKSKNPSIETGVKLAQALGVSVEYLVTGEDNSNSTIQNLSKISRLIAQNAEKLDDEKKAFVLDFVNFLAKKGYSAKK